jgi:hypothetical protein
MGSTRDPMKPNACKETTGSLFFIIIQLGLECHMFETKDETEETDLSG